MINILRSRSSRALSHHSGDLHPVSSVKVCGSTSGGSSSLAGSPRPAQPRRNRQRSGLLLLIPIIDKLVKVSLRTVAMDVPSRTPSPETTSP